MRRLLFFITLSLSLLVAVSHLPSDSSANENLTVHTLVSANVNQIDDISNDRKPQALDVAIHLPFSQQSHIFLHPAQTQPFYWLKHEFLPENWSPSLYQHLVDSGEFRPWYIAVYYSSSSASRKHRLGAWKDSNTQYTQRIDRV